MATQIHRLMRCSVCIALVAFLTNVSIKEITMAEPQSASVKYTMPSEESPHEGTWLQWPHHYQYGVTYRNRLEPTWVAITKVLADSETVHVIVYDEREKARVAEILKKSEIQDERIDLHVYPTDDVWVRDNGPIYVRDASGKLLILGWGFNGWGKKAEFSQCSQIPRLIAQDQGYPFVDLSYEMVNEGGSIELDGNGTLLACKSSIFNANRNPGLTVPEAERLFTRYLGATHFIWLEGTAGLDITDMHIDGLARFPNVSTLLTMSRKDLEEWGLSATDIAVLYAAKNKDGLAYTIVTLPLTRENVSTAYGKKLDYKGSYINYYVSNTHVLVPNYNDPHDEVANRLIQNLYKGRTVIGIDVRNLYENGGMIHCVTQQQPKP